MFGHSHASGGNLVFTASHSDTKIRIQEFCGHLKPDLVSLTLGKTLDNKRGSAVTYPCFCHMTSLSQAPCKVSSLFSQDPRQFSRHRPVKHQMPRVTLLVNQIGVYSHRKTCWVKIPRACAGIWKNSVSLHILGFLDVSPPVTLLHSQDHHSMIRHMNSVWSATWSVHDTYVISSWLVTWSVPDRHVISAWYSRDQWIIATW